MRITVYRRNTTKVSLRVTSTGQIHVTAPRFMPESEVIKFVEEHKDWLDEALKTTQQQRQKHYDFYDQLPLRNREECLAAQRRLEALIPPLVEKHARIMGVHPTAIHYRTLTSRWGQCNIRTGELTFSAFVLLLPDWCIEHVVVHELCHLLVPNHSPEFHALMDKYFPRWREARKATLRIQRMEE